MPKNPGKLDRLVAAMKAEGWSGRPVLAYQSDDGLQALTGSHRLAAARAAGLATVPVLLLEDADFPDDAAYEQLDGAEDNYDRLRGLDKVLKANPDTKAAYELMLTELIEKHRLYRAAVYPPTAHTSTARSEGGIAEGRPTHCSHCGQDVEPGEVFGAEGRWMHRPCAAHGPMERAAGWSRLWYHGDTSRRLTFDDQKFQSENGNALGPGIYFTSSKDQALGYAYPTGYVYTAQIEGRFVTDDQHPTLPELRAFLAALDEEGRYYLFSNFDEDPRKAQRSIERQYVEMPFVDAFADLGKQGGLDFRSEGRQWAAALVKLGYTGRLHKLDNVEHLSVWDPSAIRVTSEQSAEDLRARKSEPTEPTEPTERTSTTRVGFSGDQTQSYAPGDKVTLANGAAATVKRKVERQGFSTYLVQLENTPEGTLGYSELGGSTQYATPVWMKPRAAVSRVHSASCALTRVAAIELVAGAVVARKTRRQRERSRRFVGETYWMKPGEQTFAEARAPGAGAGSAGLTEVRLGPEARVLREGERDLLDLGADAPLEDVMRMAFEKGYDAVRVKDRLALLNPSAVVSRTPSGRPTWATPSGGGRGGGGRAG